MKVIKKLIIILIITVLIIFTILLIKYNKKNDTSETNTLSYNNDLGEQKTEITKVKSASAYFTVQSCVNKYILYISEQDKESIYNLLDFEYIEENNINRDNILNKIEKIPEQVTFEAEKMYVEEIDDNHSKYYTSGVLKQNNLEESIIINNNFNIAVNMDFDNMIFSIIPLENGGVFDEKIN